jgi:pyridoxamine 5'-phosphate oxidase
VSDWKRLLDEALASHAQLPQSRFASLATVRPDGRPANRTITFRFFASGSRLVFTSDARAEKLLHLARQPWGELCWYFPQSRQQFRLGGPVQPASVLGEEEHSKARRRLWHERSEGFRQSFTWPPPRQPRSKTDAFEVPAPAEPSENFVLLLLEPRTVDVLDTRAHPHERRFFSLVDGEWQHLAVNP